MTVRVGDISGAVRGSFRVGCFIVSGWPGPSTVRVRTNTQHWLAWSINIGRAGLRQIGLMAWTQARNKDFFFVTSEPKGPKHKN